MSSDRFICSVCGHDQTYKGLVRHRELAACSNCGSNMRFRAIACGLTRALAGRAGVLADLVTDRNIRGVGVSDADVYAQVLERKFDYTNTFLHTAPHLDIESRASFEHYGRLDFIVCSDVVGHTLKMPVRVLGNLLHALKPGGYLVLSAPTFEMRDSIERYPSLASFEVVNHHGVQAVVYKTTFGTQGVDENPVFHGGPGRVLELRVLSHEQLLEEVRLVGFEVVPLLADTLALYGADWPRCVERADLPFALDGAVIVARRPAPQASKPTQ